MLSAFDKNRCLGGTVACLRRQEAGGAQNSAFRVAGVLLNPWLLCKHVLPDAGFPFVPLRPPGDLATTVGAWYQVAS